MKTLDEVVVQAITDMIIGRYKGYDYDGEHHLETFLRRSDIKLDPQGASFLIGDPFDVLPRLFVGKDAEKMLLRLASPKEYAGDYLKHGDTVQQLNDILWAEDLNIEMQGATPVLKEIAHVNRDAQSESANRETASPTVAVAKSPVANGVFIVHGRALGTKDTVVRFLIDLQLAPIVLQELPGKGRTIAEKFEDHASDAGFAVVIFTPDDKGSLAGEGSESQPRARQNVIFELGFFIGKLGRSKVSVLHKGEVEIPSDYAGVEYIVFDDTGGWKSNLIRELRSAGFDVDANLAI